MLLVLSLSLYAQDARNRTVETVVADVLAAMPAQTADVLSSHMADLAAAAPQSVVEVAKLMKPAAAGVKNSIYEYALTGLVNYVNDPQHNAKAADVLKGLQEAASACQDAVNKSFFESLQNMLRPYQAPQEEPGLTLKEAKKLLKAGSTAEKCLAACTIMKEQPAKVWKTVASALKSNDGQFRNSVIDNATKAVGANALVPLFASKFKKLGNEAKADVLNWFGDNKISAVSDLVASAVNEGGEIGKAAISAAGKIGGKKALSALLGQLGGENGDECLTALKSFKGDIQDDVCALLAPSIKDRREVVALENHIITLPYALNVGMVVLRKPDENDAAITQRFDALLKFAARNDRLAILAYDTAPKSVVEVDSKDFLCRRGKRGGERGDFRGKPLHPRERPWGLRERPHPVVEIFRYPGKDVVGADEERRRLRELPGKGLFRGREFRFVADAARIEDDEYRVRRKSLEVARRRKSRLKPRSISRRAPDLEPVRAKRPGEKFGRHIRKKRDFHMLLGTSGGHLLKIE